MTRMECVLIRGGTEAWCASQSHTRLHRPWKDVSPGRLQICKAQKKNDSAGNWSDHSARELRADFSTALSLGLPTLTDRFPILVSPQVFAKPSSRINTTEDCREFLHFRFQTVRQSA